MILSINTQKGTVSQAFFSLNLALMEPHSYQKYQELIDAFQKKTFKLLNLAIN
jgi:FtsZ-interacting cell division protein YlmF